MPLTGDFKKLSAMIARFDGAASTLPKATKVAEKAAETQYAGDFSQQRDPWGSAWTPPLQRRSGDLSGTKATSSGGVVRIRPPKYWVFLQVGANGMNQRAVLPFAPSRWDAPIQREIDEVVIGHFIG